MVRSWIRQALRASGVAILVPATVLAAVALSVLGGGRNVGSLAEVLRGPAVPPAEAAQAPAVPRHATRSRSAPLANRARAARRARPAPPVPVRRHATAAPPVRTLPVGRPHPRRPAPGQQPPVTTAPPPSAPAPPPAPPHPVHDLGTQAADTLRPLPLAGPAAAAAVQAAVDLVDPA